MRSKKLFHLQWIEEEGGRKPRKLRIHHDFEDSYIILKSKNRGIWKKAIVHRSFEDKLGAASAAPSLSFLNEEISSVGICFGQGGSNGLDMSRGVYASAPLVRCRIHEIGRNVVAMSKREYVNL